MLHINKKANILYNPYQPVYLVFNFVHGFEGDGAMKRYRSNKASYR